MNPGESDTKTSADGPELTNVLSKKYEKRFLNSFPDPLGLNALALTDELGNGGFYSKTYSAPYEANNIYNGPTLPVMLDKKR